MAGSGTPSRSSLRIGKTNSDGDFASACNTYRNLQEFEELFRERFRDFLEGQIDQETGQKTLEQESTPVEIQPVPRAEFLRFRTRAYLPR